MALGSGIPRTTTPNTPQQSHEISSLLPFKPQTKEPCPSEKKDPTPSKRRNKSTIKLPQGRNHPPTHHKRSNKTRSRFQFVWFFHCFWVFKRIFLFSHPFPEPSSRLESFYGYCYSYEKIFFNEVEVVRILVFHSKKLLL